MLALGLAACRDDVSGPGGLRRAFLNVLPVFQPTASLQGTGREVDTVRVRLQRPGASAPAIDTFFVFPPNSDSLVMVLDVPISGGEEEFEAALEMRSQGEVLFSGVQRVRALAASAPGSGTPAQVPIVFVGPGATARTVSLTPRDTVLTFGDSVDYTAVARDSAQTVLPNAVIAFSTDTGFSISAAGVLRAPARRGVIRVRARVPGGPADSTTLRIVPRAAVIRSQVGLVADSVGAVVPVAVRVLAADSLGVQGVPVRFAAALGGGTVRDTLVVTDSVGVAATTVTYGPTVGLNRVTASVAGLGLVQAEVTSRAGAARALELVSGSAQSATVGDTLAQRLTVRARDRFGNPSAGAPVRVRATSVGTALDTVVTTDAAGLGRARARLRNAAGANTFVAALSADTTQTVTFTATGTPAPAASLQLTAGGGQVVVAGATGASLQVEVRDAFSNLRAGDSVTFSHPGGARWADSSSVVRVVHGATSALSPAFRAAISAGADSIVVTTGALRLRVPLTVVAGPAARVIVASGAGQTAAAGDTLPAPLVALVQDQFGNLTSGRVTFAARRAGGTLTPPAVDALPGIGLATTRYRVSPTVGADTVWASLGTIDSVAFPLTAVPGAASALQIVSGNSQTDTVAASLALPLAVRATDAFGNAVPGAAVRFRVLAAPSAQLTDSVVVASATGVAATQLRLPTTVGPLQVRAQLVADSTRHVLFAATATAGTAAAIEVASTPPAPRTVADSLSTPIVFRVRDGFGNTVGAGRSGVVRVLGGTNARVNGDSASAVTTDASGEIRAFVRLATVVGANLVQLQVGNVAQTVSLSSTAAPPSSVTLVDFPANGTVATLSTVPIRVLVVDAFGNRVIGDTVTFSALRGGPFLDSTAVVRIVTDTLGEARTPLVRFSSTPGVDSGLVVIRGITRVWRTTVNAGAADATQSGWTYAGPAPWAPWGPASGSLPTMPTFIVRDAAGNRLPGVPVRISTLGPRGTDVGRGTLGGTDTSVVIATDANGEVRPTTWVFGFIGRNSLRAEAGAVSRDFVASAAPPGTTHAWVGPTTAGGDASLTTAANWYPAVVPGAGTNAFIGPIFTARPVVTGTVAIAADTSYIETAPAIASGATLRLQSAVTVIGAQFDTSGTVSFARSGQFVTLSSFSGDSVRLPAVRIDSFAVIGGIGTINGSLEVPRDLTFTGQALTVRGLFSVVGPSANFRMPSGGILRALGGATFNGDSSTYDLQSGLLEVQGRFRQLNDFSGASFRPDLGFTTIFSGPSDSVSFASPLTSFAGSGFSTLIVGAGATLNTIGLVPVGSVLGQPGATLNVPVSSTVALAPFQRLTLGPTTTYNIAGSVTAACYVNEPTAVRNVSGTFPFECASALAIIGAAPTTAFQNLPLSPVTVELRDAGGQPRLQSGVTLRAEYLNALGNPVEVGGVSTATTGADGRATFSGIVIPVALTGTRLRFSIANDPQVPAVLTAPFDVDPPSLVDTRPSDRIAVGVSNDTLRDAPRLVQLRLQTNGTGIAGVPVSLALAADAPSGARVWPAVAVTDAQGAVVIDSIAVGAAAPGSSWHIRYVVQGVPLDSAVVRVVPDISTQVWVGGDGPAATTGSDWQQSGNWKPEGVPSVTSRVLRRSDWSVTAPRLDVGSNVFEVNSITADTLFLVSGRLRVTNRFDARVVDSLFAYPGNTAEVILANGAVGRGSVPQLRIGAGVPVTIDGTLAAGSRVVIDPLATLDIGNDTLYAFANFSAVGGLLRMNDAAGRVFARGDSVQFQADNNPVTPALTAGVLEVSGQFDARSGDGLRSFRATAPHVTRFVGSIRQTIRLAAGSSGDQRFGVIENANVFDSLLFVSPAQADSIRLRSGSRTGGAGFTVSAPACVRDAGALVNQLPSCPGEATLLTALGGPEYLAVVPQAGQEAEPVTQADVEFRVADADDVPVANQPVQLSVIGGGLNLVGGTAVRTTSATGRVQGAAQCVQPGSHQLVATYSPTVADTARVICAPAGTAVVWRGLGVDTTDWVASNNWIRYGINSSATDLYPTPGDSVYIPAYGAGRRLAIVGETRGVAKWTMEGGALVWLTTALLDVAGSLMAGDGSVGTGLRSAGNAEVRLSSAGAGRELSGRFDGLRLFVQRPEGADLAGPLYADSLTVIEGPLTLNGWTATVPGMFRVEELASLRMQGTKDSLEVGNVYWLSTMRDVGGLSAGTIVVTGDWRDTAGVFLPSDNHRVVFNGTNQTIFFPVFADTSQRRFHRLRLETAGTLTMQAAVNVVDSLVIGAPVTAIVGSPGPASATLNTFGEVIIAGTPNLHSIQNHNSYGPRTPVYPPSGALAPQITTIERGDQIVTTAGAGIPGRLELLGNTTLATDGYEFIVDSTMRLSYGARLQMTVPGSALTVRDSLLFYAPGISTNLSEGTLSVGGDLRMVFVDPLPLTPTGNWGLRAFRAASATAPQVFDFGGVSGVVSLTRLINDNTVSQLRLGGYDTLAVGEWQAGPLSNTVGNAAASGSTLNFGATCTRGAGAVDDFVCASQPVAASVLSGQGQALTVGFQSDDLVFRLRDADGIGVPAYAVEIGGTDKLSAPTSATTDFAGRVKLAVTCATAGSHYLRVGPIPGAPVQFAPDSVAVICAPVGTTHIWRGNVSSDWFAALNWDSGSVPDAAARVYLPALTGGSDALVLLSATIAGLRIESGADLAVGSEPGVVLTINGPLEVDSGAVILDAGLSPEIHLGGTGVLQGTINPRVRLFGTADYLLAGTTSIAGGIELVDDAYLSLNNHRLVATGGVSASARSTLSMINAGDTLRVGTALNLARSSGQPSIGDFTDGHIIVEGPSATVSLVRGAYRPTGKHTMAFVGTGNVTLGMTPGFSTGDVSYVRTLFANNAGRLLATTNLAVRDSLVLGIANTGIAGSGLLDGRPYLYTEGAIIVENPAATFSLDTVFVRGMSFPSTPNATSGSPLNTVPLVLDGSSTVVLPAAASLRWAAPIRVADGSVLDLNTASLIVGDTLVFEEGSELRMNGFPSALILEPSVPLLLNNSTNTFTNGQLNIGEGKLVVSSGADPAVQFNASGGFELALNGGGVIEFPNRTTDAPPLTAYRVPVLGIGAGGTGPASLLGVVEVGDGFGGGELRLFNSLTIGAGSRLRSAVGVTCSGTGAVTVTGQFVQAGNPCPGTAPVQQIVTAADTTVAIRAGSSATLTFAGQTANAAAATSGQMVISVSSVPGAGAAELPLVPSTLLLNAPSNTVSVNCAASADGWGSYRVTATHLAGDDTVRAAYRVHCVPNYVTLAYAPLSGVNTSFTLPANWLVPHGLPNAGRATASPGASDRAFLIGDVPWEVPVTGAQTVASLESGRYLSGAYATQGVTLVTAATASLTVNGAFEASLDALFTPGGTLTLGGSGTAQNTQGLVRGATLVIAGPRQLVGPLDTYDAVTVQDSVKFNGYRWSAIARPGSEADDFTVTGNGRLSMTNGADQLIVDRDLIIDGAPNVLQTGEIVAYKAMTIGNTNGGIFRPAAAHSLFLYGNAVTSSDISFSMASPDTTFGSGNFIGSLILLANSAPGATQPKVITQVLPVRGFSIFTQFTSAELSGGGYLFVQGNADFQGTLDAQSQASAAPRVRVEGITTVPTSGQIIHGANAFLDFFDLRWGGGSYARPSPATIRACDVPTTSPASGSPTPTYDTSIPTLILLRCPPS